METNYSTDNNSFQGFYLCTNAVAAWLFMDLLDNTFYLNISNDKKNNTMFFNWSWNLKWCLKTLNDDNGITWNDMAWHGF